MWPPRGTQKQLNSVGNASQCPFSSAINPPLVQSMIDDEADAARGRTLHTNWKTITANTTA
jgi:hypothetical protein